MVEENHYYPFGLTLASTAAGTTPQPYKFQGKEFEKSLSLELNDFGARMYDPQLGRWNVVDPMAEKYPSMSPYVAMANNPVMFVDPDERDPIFAKNFWGNVNLIGDDGQNTEQSYLVSGSVKKDVKASTKRGEKYTGSLVENENVYNIPTGAVMEDVISSVNETRKSKRENGGHVNIGERKATRWDEGGEAFEFIDKNGNKGAKA